MLSVPCLKGRGMWWGCWSRGGRCVCLSSQNVWNSRRKVFVRETCLLQSRKGLFTLKKSGLNYSNPSRSLLGGAEDAGALLTPAGQTPSDSADLCTLLPMPATLSSFVFKCHWKMSVATPPATSEALSCDGPVAISCALPIQDSGELVLTWGVRLSSQCSCSVRTWGLIAAAIWT
jgi:hypothetical protein